MRRWALLVAVLLALSGCLSGEDAFWSEWTHDDDPQPIQRTYYLNADQQLTPAEPIAEDPASVPMGSFYTNWTQGNEQPTWTAQPINDSMRVTQARLTFFYTAEQAVPTTGPQEEGFPEFVVYVGTEQAPMGHASVQAPDMVVSGQMVAVTTSLTLPQGGLVLPAGAAPIVKIAPVQGQTDAYNELELLVNGTDAPTHLDLEGETLLLPPTATQDQRQSAGQLAGSAYATGPMEGTTAANHTVDVTSDMLGLQADLERTQGAGIADIDLRVLGPNGTLVAQSVTPEDDEGIALYAPNLEAIGYGTWTLQAVNYGNAAVEYELTIQRLGPAHP